MPFQPYGGFGGPSSFGNDMPAPGGFAMPYGSGMGMNTGGVPHRQMGGQMPWFAKNEARSLTHVGPINSIVPGRTDRINAHVPSGAYVIPASVISHWGQSNSNAGMAVAHRMFGSGPLGTPLPKMGRGMGLPKPPKPFASDRGGARGDHIGAPTPVILAGGEYVVAPSRVAEIGHGSLEDGHRVLDEMVKRVHKKHAKEIARLPPPAKS
jgi:hypothetical protein